ncbi:hypothetical protein diail_9306 [Diaporthe ilicicola]|nr:hypothetical protein diail_9306 [Diaporthe ilicicola]
MCTSEGSTSPFIFDYHDARRELLDPAINGAITVLEAAARYGGSVRRVVTTAPFASELDMLAGKRPGHTYTEADWNPMTYDEAAAYCASEALARRASGRGWRPTGRPLTSWRSARPGSSAPTSRPSGASADAVRSSIPELRHRIPGALRAPRGRGWQEVETGAVYAIDSGKAQKILGIDYTPLSACMEDSCLELIKAEIMYSLVAGCLVEFV